MKNKNNKKRVRIAKQQALLFFCARKDKKMYELTQVGERTYYIESPAKIGVYRINEEEVYLIDSGNDKDAGRKIIKITDANGWKVAGIINTHSNADHIGGNQFIQKRTQCKIFSTEIENIFTKYPILETSFLYGGYPPADIRNKFLLAQPSDPSGNVEQNLPDGLELIRLPGHYFDMIGIKTSDQVVFLADCLFGETILHKYHISFIYDVKEFLNTLEIVEKIEANLFLPSHAEAVTDIRPLVALNREKVMEIIEVILGICSEAKTWEEILKEVFDYYQLTMDFNQYVLVGSTVRSYLSYLYENKKLEICFTDNRLLWKKVE